ncbi:lytic transglycosylase domain-containing protein [Sphingomonas natans]|uniref:lytic transglycosylase domain-containing protein n=1 Tax=Sphingomonas natans TaxID=3063330 RepID=UPI003133A1A9
MQRAGGIAIFVAALSAQGAGAQEAQVAFYGKAQAALITQRNGAAISGASEFTLYELNVWTPPSSAESDAEALELSATEADAIGGPRSWLPSEATVLRMMAAAFSDAGIRRKAPKTIGVANCDGLMAVAPLRASISVATDTARRTFYPIVRAAECKYRLPAGLMDSVVLQESRYNPMVVSPKGAGGLSQLMPLTASGLGVTNRFDPRANIDGGARYLRQLLDQFGAVPLALAAYNAGPGSVLRAKGIPQNKETLNYVRNVLAYWREPGETYRNPGSEAHRMAVLLDFMTN